LYELCETQKVGEKMVGTLNYASEQQAASARKEISRSTYESQKPPYTAIAGAVPLDTYLDLGIAALITGLEGAIVSVGDHVYTDVVSIHALHKLPMHVQANENYQGRIQPNRKGNDVVTEFTIQGKSGLDLLVVGDDVPPVQTPYQIDRSKTHTAVVPLEIPLLFEPNFAVLTRADGQTHMYTCLPNIGIKYS
jgi:hypothetical protein